MKEFILSSLVLLGCLYPLCSAQTIRPSCNLNNCSRTNVEICATNGQQCRRFPNECSFESVNCNATLSTVWNRTDTIECLNLSVNATGLCSCPALRTCSNQTTTAGICTHRDGHACRLFRTECDLVRARCNREIWRNIDRMQCRGFSFNQTRTCTCPKSLLCSRNETLLCVQVNQTICRLYNNECDLEGDRCRGERLLDINNIHCRGFSVGANRTCLCPNLMICQRNITNICVRNANNRCQLISNQCDLERQRCQGNVLTPTISVQCRNIRAGQTGDCACPGLASCSMSRTNICVRTRVGCRLKTNECELERARCFGEVAIPVPAIQCRGFLPGDGRACTCPRLDTCNRGNTTVCVRSERGCVLLRNECHMEQGRCEGQNLTVVDPIQCENFSINHLRNCSCPNMGICSANSPNICAATADNQCRLMRNRCELEKARCQGNTLPIINPLQCSGLPANATGNCFCPQLRNCSSNLTNICVREINNNNTCLLLRNECEVEQAICEGRRIRRVDSIFCRNFTHNVNRTCYCPNLATCNRNSSTMCAINSTQCRLFRNECELEQAKCENAEPIKTHATQCLNFEINQQSNCSCPNLLTCIQNPRKVCIRTRAGCKLLTTQCEFEEALCRGEALRSLEPLQCQGFRDYEEKSCHCPNLETCSNNTTNLCVRNQENICSLFENACDLERAKCRGQALTIVQQLHCSNFTIARPSTCHCPNLFNCSQRSSSTCVKTISRCKLLRNQCEVENEKCHRAVQILSPLNCLGFTYGQTANCTCPNLKTCSRSNRNICVRTNTGCSLLRNECELERLRCEGQKLKIIPLIQCRLLETGNEGACACPNWLSCQQNSSKICVETEGGCRLLENQCDLEQRRCYGEVINITSIMQCQGFMTGQLKNCACPDLQTCSHNNSTQVCVKSHVNCKLMANTCDYERAKCRGEKWCLADKEQCRNFAVGQSSKCNCPKLQTCSLDRSTNICVNLRGACKLMKNQCELEKAKCKGQAWRRTNAIQCQNYRANEWQWCACPRLFNCCNKENKFCVKGPRGCKIMKSDCQLQLARCRGEVWTRVDDLHCNGFKFGESVKTCTCPKLSSCHRISSTTRETSAVCVRGLKGCKLFRNKCEVERALCNGEVWHPVNSVQCLNFPLHHTRSCYCPNLDNCSNTTKVCARGPQNQCYNFRTECDFRWAQCEGEVLSLTLNQRCQGIGFDEHNECKCPETLNCNRSRRVCARKDGQCRLFKNECEFKKSVCRAENWQRTALSNCCQFRVNQIKACTLNLSSAICAQNEDGTCRLFPSRCDLNRAKLSEEKAWSEVDSNNCKCLRSSRSGVCAKRIDCNPTDRISRAVCGVQDRTYRLFDSRCFLRLHNYQTCSNFREVRIRECRERAE